MSNSKDDDSISSFFRKSKSSKSMFISSDSLGDDVSSSESSSHGQRHFNVSSGNSEVVRKFKISHPRAQTKIKKTSVNSSSTFNRSDDESPDKVKVFKKKFPHVKKKIRNTNKKYSRILNESKGVQNKKKEKKKKKSRMLNDNRYIKKSKDPYLTIGIGQKHGSNRSPVLKSFSKKKPKKSKVEKKGKKVKKRLFVTSRQSRKGATLKKRKELSEKVFPRLNEILGSARRLEIQSALRYILDLLDIGLEVKFNSTELRYADLIIKKFFEVVAQEGVKNEKGVEKEAQKLLDALTPYEKHLFFSTRNVCSVSDYYFFLKSLEELVEEISSKDLKMTKTRLLELMCLGFFGGEVEETTLLKEGPGIIVNTFSSGSNCLRILGSRNFQFNQPGSKVVQVIIKMKKHGHFSVEVDYLFRNECMTISTERRGIKTSRIAPKGSLSTPDSKIIFVPRYFVNFEVPFTFYHQQFKLSPTEIFQVFPEKFYHFFNISSQNGVEKLFCHFIWYQNKKMIKIFTKQFGVQFLVESLSIHVDSKTKRKPFPFLVVETRNLEFIKWYFEQIPTRLRMCVECFYSPYNSIKNSSPKKKRRSKKYGLLEVRIPLNVHLVDILDPNDDREMEIMCYVLTLKGVDMNGKVENFNTTTVVKYDSLVDGLIHKNGVSLLSFLISEYNLNHFHINDLKYVGVENETFSFVKRWRMLYRYSDYKFFPKEYKNAVIMTALCMLHLLEAKDPSSALNVSVKLSETRLFFIQSNLIYQIFKFIDYFDFQNQIGTTMKNQFNQKVVLWDQFDGRDLLNPKLYIIQLQKIQEGMRKIFLPDYDIHCKILVDEVLEYGDLDLLSEVPNIEGKKNYGSDPFDLLAMTQMIKSRVFCVGVKNTGAFLKKLVGTKIKEEIKRIRWIEQQIEFNRGNVYFRMPQMEMNWLDMKEKMKYYKIYNKEKTKKWSDVVHEFVVFIKNFK